MAVGKQVELPGGDGKGGYRLLFRGPEDQCPVIAAVAGAYAPSRLFQSDVEVPRFGFRYGAHGVLFGRGNPQVPYCHGFWPAVCSGAAEIEPRPAVRRAPLEAVHHGQRVVGRPGVGARCVEVGRADGLVEQVDVPETQRSVFEQQVGAVETAVEPDGPAALPLVVFQDGEGRGRRDGIPVTEPAGRVTERFDADFACAVEGIQHRELFPETLFHHGPREGVLLPGLGVGEPEGRIVGQRTVEVADPAGVAAALGIDGFEGFDRLNVGAQSVVVLVDGVASQHAEDGDRNLHRLVLGRHVGVLPAGIVGSRPVAAPERVAVGADLVLHVAGGFDAVFFVHVGQRAGIEEPAAHHPGIGAENVFEIFHVDIDQLFPFGRRVAGGEAYVRMPVPRETAPPGESGPFDVGLGDLPPGSGFVPPAGRLFQQFGVAGLHEGIVLQQEGAPEPVAVHQFHLACGGFVEHVFGDLRKAGLAEPDEVDDVDDTWSVAVGFCRASRQEGGEQAQQDEVAWFHGWFVFGLYK